MLLEDVLGELRAKGVEGADLVGTFKGDSIGVRACCVVNGVNNAGQMVVQGFEPGPFALNRSSVGTPFLLDTLPLNGMAVLKGDEQ